MPCPASLTRSLVALVFSLTATVSISQQLVEAPKIHIVYMGGDDCPPCVAWRKTELPKLEKTEAFKSVQFSFVNKLIKSPVPSAFFLPQEVKPLKDKLQEASAGRSGSPHLALVVNGEVFDYYFGVRSADEVEQMILSVRDGKPYPFEHCVKIAGMGKCALKG